MKDRMRRTGTVTAAEGYGSVLPSHKKELRHTGAAAPFLSV